MKLDTRRITGPHLLLPGPGAAAELRFAPGEDAQAWLGRWRLRAAALSAALGWRAEVAVRPWAGGASVGLTAPPDLLELACAVVEAAAAEGEPPLEALRARAEAEARPALRAAYAAATARGLPCFDDDEGFTAGLGARGCTWPLDALPDAAALAQAVGAQGPLGSIPVAQITGTNGKTTSSRLLAHIGAVAGLLSGHTSSDGVVVAGQTLHRGDWTGPGAARLLLRDPRVQLAVLESARGGLMRRGLPFVGTWAAAVTNISADHLGDWGLLTLEDMAEAKCVIARALRPEGVFLTRAEDPHLEAALPAVRARRPDLRLHTFCAEGPRPGAVAWAEGGALWLHDRRLCAVDEVPLTWGGLARHNVENALCAAGLAWALGLPHDAVVEGLRTFEPSLEQSRGRLNRFAVRGAQVIVDFCHNPDGMRRLVELARALPARRRLIVLGQAGDRGEALVQQLVDEALALPPDHVIVKELPGHLLGTPLGEMPARIEGMLRARGFTALEHATDELDAARRVLAWLAPGDLALLLVHERLDDTVALLREG